MAKAGEQQGPPPQLTELESLQLKCNEVRMYFEGSRDTMVPTYFMSIVQSGKILDYRNLYGRRI